jgi:hypothetical protein
MRVVPLLVFVGKDAISIFALADSELLLAPVIDNEVLVILGTNTPGLTLEGEEDIGTILLFCLVLSVVVEGAD